MTGEMLFEEVTSSVVLKNIMDALTKEYDDALWDHTSEMFDGGSLASCDKANSRLQFVKKIKTLIPETMWKQHEGQKRRLKAAKLRAEADALESGHGE